MQVSIFLSPKLDVQKMFSLRSMTKKNHPANSLLSPVVHSTAQFVFDSYLEMRLTSRSSNSVKAHDVHCPSKLSPEQSEEGFTLSQVCAQPEHCSQFCPITLCYLLLILKDLFHVPRVFSFGSHIFYFRNQEVTSQCIHYYNLIVRVSSCQRQLGTEMLMLFTLFLSVWCLREALIKDLHFRQHCYLDPVINVQVIVTYET